MGFLKKLFGDKASRDYKALQPILQKTLQAYEEIVKLDIDSLRHKTVEFKEYIKEKTAVEVAEIAELKAKAEANFDMDSDEKEKLYERIDKLEKEELKHIEEALNEILPQAYAVVKAAAKYFCEHETVVVTATDLDRDLAAKYEHVTIEGDKACFKNSWMAGGNMVTWDMVHYDCQIIGGIVLNNTVKQQGKLQMGCIAEMATGEGKTLVATLPVYLNALAGKGVHVVTVNDYLAKRDSEWMGAMFEFLGLTVDCIDKREPNSAERRRAYQADITYGTNSEFGFDYLRDNMTSNLDELVQRGHHYALVDEVDSVLIDDARTPLIISGPTQNGDQQEYKELDPVVCRLYRDQESKVNEILVEAKRILSDPKTVESILTWANSTLRDVSIPSEEKRGACQFLRAYRGLPKNKALIRFISEKGLKNLIQAIEGYYLQQSRLGSDANSFLALDNDLSDWDVKNNKDILEFNEKVEKFNKLLDSISTLDEERQRKKREDLRKDAANVRKELLELVEDCWKQLYEELEDKDDIKFAKVLDNIIAGYKDLEYLNGIAESSPAHSAKPFDDLRKDLDNVIAEKIDDAEKAGFNGKKDKEGLKRMRQRLQGASVAITEDFRLTEMSEVIFGKNGLYFVIDEQQKSVDITARGIETLTEGYNTPDFFVLPNVGASIADLEHSDLTNDEKVLRKAELMRDFAEKSNRLHTVHQLLKAYALFENDVDYVVTMEQNEEGKVVKKVKIVDEQTGRIMEGRRWSDGLHQAVEAKEGATVEAATQTYATITLQNYFRMYHKLAGMTGTAETEAGEFWDIYKLDVVVIPTNRPIARIDMDDRIYKTKKEKYKAVIEEIKRLVDAGRPVLVGTTSVDVSQVLDKMLNLSNIPHNVLNAKLHFKEAQVVKEAGQAGKVTIATNMAGRGTDIKLGEGVKEAGGLAIIGTERHESRRVDRQLRGRAGRQGDPGSSLFFISLEDDLLRRFGFDTKLQIAGIKMGSSMAELMDKLMGEGEAITDPMISRSVERAQKKVEEINFGARKHLLEYDDVMNAQREFIYERRHHALYGERLSIDINNMMYEFGEKIIDEFKDAKDYENFKLELLSSMGIEAPFSEEEFDRKKTKELANMLFDAALERYKEKARIIGEKTLPAIKNVYENQPRFERILIPITDGKRNLNVIVNLKKAVENGAREVNLCIEKSIVLKLIDNAWIEHLRDLDDLKENVINGASYEQKDPVVMYKLKAFPMFNEMLEKINEDVISFLMRADIPLQDPENVRESRPQGIDKSRMREQRQDPLSQAHSRTQQREVTQPIRVEKKVGRNDPCPCGSGKKYKNCHGRMQSEV